ncbi:MAG: glycosyltransferase family A protein, partial [Polyangiaceae bacterium]
MKRAHVSLAPRLLEPLVPGPEARVSIGLPVRNGAASIELALGTLVHQTHQNLDIIISDNASTDRTREICERFVRRDRRVRYFKQPEVLPANENFRFVKEQCDSSWFMLASHDDLRDDNYVEVLLAGFRANPRGALVVTDAAYFSDYARRERSGPELPPTRSVKGASFS